ncbi:MAG: sodium-dependent transporter [Ruminococcaceae bacterium]|nr:sodium-dependent transporter [Oscillospiraceae bacterium]
MENKRGFSSTLGFLLSMAAFSIGIGNLWKFPYIVGANGGGAFLLVYLLIVILVGIPGFLIELTLGRTSGLSPIKGMEKLEGKKTGWSVIGVLGCFAIFTICSYATMIVGGWTGNYILNLITGSMKSLDSAGISNLFGATAGSNLTIVFSFLQAALLWLCLISGVKIGVEKVCSVLMPTLFIILVVLAFYSNSLPGSAEGLLWYLTPNLKNVSMNTVSAAACQVFYSIGMGQAGAFVYGSYIDKKTNLTKSVVAGAAMDTFIAVLAGLVIVPALFAFDLEPAMGPSLVYITLPNLFNAMGSFGTVFGLLFMICVFFAGFTSILGGSEALVATVCDNLPKLNRKVAATIVCTAEFLFSLLFTFSFRGGFFAEFKALGLGFFDFFDFLATTGMALGVAVMLVYILSRWKFYKFQSEANEGAGSKIRVHSWMKYYINYGYPVVLVIVFVCLAQMYF